MNRVLLTSGMRKYLLMAAMMLAGTMTAGAQTQYVFMRNNGSDYYYANNNTWSSNTTFNPSYIWTLESGVPKNNGRYLIITRTSTENSLGYYTYYTYAYSASLSTTSNNVYTFSISNGSVITTAQQESSFAWNNTTYYLPYNLGTLANNTADNNRVIAYQVTTTENGSSTEPTISGNDVLSATTTYNYSAAGAAYQPTYTNYRFNNADHYFDANGNSITPTPATIGSPTWSISDNEYATVNESTGAVTVNSLPESDIELTLTVTYPVTAGTGTPAAPSGVTLTATKTITLQGTNPSAPTITVSGTTVTMATDATGTTTIRYTLDGSDPTTSSTAYSGPIDVSGQTTSPVIIKAITVRGDNASSVTEQEVTLTLPAPTITADASAGTATISSSVAGATIYYTTDGTTPTTSSTQYTGTISGLSLMTTVKAIAVKSGWNDSPEASATLTLPSGVDAGTGIVTLFDYEPHSWSYYSDPQCPIRSLNPADIKITYYGNGQTANNMTTSDVKDVPTSFGAKATGVQVSATETENTFVYYKTLERTNGEGAASKAAANGAAMYTTIPNPFQVRPTGQDNGNQSITPSSRTIVIVTNRTANNSGFDNGSTLSVSWGGSIRATINSRTTTTILAPVGETVTLTYTANSTDNRDNRSTVTVYYDANGGTQIFAQYTPNTNRTRTFTVAAPASQTVACGTYRGFYAWRVKSKSASITSITDVDGNTFSNDIIPAETDIRINTSSEYGNEIEFEALWAQAYATTGSTDLSYAVSSSTPSAYERNFHILNASTAATNFQKGYPCTVIGRAPNSTTLNATRAVTGAFTAASDTKFEELNITGATNSTWTAAGHDLIIGRGCSSTVGTVRGLSDGTSGAVEYTIRLESGTFGTFNMIDGTTHTHSGTVSAKTIFGCDYDRAKGDNNKLSIGSNNTVYGASSYQQFTSNTNRNNLTYDWNIKSGTVQASKSVAAGSAAECIYMGNSGSGDDSDGNRYQGKRRMIMEGGEVCNIAGGLNNYGNSYATYIVNDGWALQIRIKGGTVRGSVYGAAEFAGASGDRQFIITGGTINGWVAGGANGTHNDGGELYGSTALYIGGTAVIGSESGGTHVGGYNSSYGTNGADGGNVFGAGCGILPNNGNFQTGTVGRVNNSTVIVADETHIWRDVHGGGNYGWVRDNGTSSIYILGGTIGGNNGYGNVFGGSNNQQGQEVAITVKGGDVKGGVYGGSHSWGVINDNVTMNISGGLVETGVFGGGYGTAQNSCDITGTVDITMTGGNVLYGLYGGGNVNSKIGGNVTIQIDGGQVGTSSNNASVYGGGLGAATRMKGDVTVNVGSRDNSCNVSGTAVIYGDVYGGSAKGVTNCNDGGTLYATGTVTNVTLNKGTIYGSLYGGGHGIDNAEANVWGPVTVKVFGGTVTGGVYGANNLNGAPQNSVTVDIYGTDAQPGKGYAIANVYGGGNQAEYANDDYPTVTIHNATPSIGNVYGGGNAAAVTNTKVTVFGGNRIGAVYAGGNGTGVLNTFQMVTGNANAYICGGTIERVFAGNNSSGIVSGTKYVRINADSSEVANAANCIAGGHHSMQIGAVFHGGNNAAGSPGTVKIVCTGGDSEGIDTLFGGANNANIVDNDMSTAANVTLDIDRGHIRKGIFGGNNAGGSVTGNITINLKKNSGNTCAFTYPTVFGGGYGEGTSTGGNITINIGEKTATNTSPTIAATIEGGAVYGGSALGSVNGSSSNTTTINIYNCTVSTGNIYGGGLGEARNATKGMVNGAVQVNISTEDQTPANCVIDLRNSSIYGCNNTGGSPQSDVRIDVWKTGFLDGNYTSGESGTLYAIDQVFGGGNAADYDPAGDNKATVYIHNCVNSIRRVFGGGNAAAAKGVVTTIDGGRYDWVFGGGNGEGEGNPGADIGIGGTNLTVNAGRINHLFGGSNERGTIGGQMRTDVNYSKMGTSGCDELIIEFFGGGNLAPIGSEGNPVNLSTTIACNTIFTAVYGGSNLADIYGDVTLTIEGGTIGEVYGGSKGRLADNSDLLNPIAAKAADIHGNVKLNIYGGAIGRAYGGSNINGNITGAIGVDLDWKGDCPGKSVDYIYGGSNQAAYTPTASGALSPNFSPTVKLINGVVNYNVYGGGRGGSATVTANPKVIAGDGTTPTNNANVQGDIFGGGDAAAVTGSTNVIVTHNTPVGGNVFGGGNAAAIQKNEGVGGSTEVLIEDKARVYGNVYGGGNQGEVEGNTKVIVNGN